MSTNAGRPLSPWADLILRRLESGPRSYGRIVSEASLAVPPGRAYRHIVDHRASAAAKRGSEYQAPASERDKDAAIRSGQVTIAKHAIRNLSLRGIVAVYDEDGVKMVRRA